MKKGLLIGTGIVAGALVAAYFLRKKQDVEEPPIEVEDTDYEDVTDDVSDKVEEYYSNSYSNDFESIVVYDRDGIHKISGIGGIQELTVNEALNRAWNARQTGKEKSINDTIFYGVGNGHYVYRDVVDKFYSKTNKIPYITEGSPFVTFKTKNSLRDFIAWLKENDGYLVSISGIGSKNYFPYKKKNPYLKTK